MAGYHDEARERAARFAERRRLTLLRELGFGQDGVAFETSNRTVVKCFVFSRQYENERDVYQHLDRFAISDVRGFAVPRYLDSHDELLVVEMSFVSRPCVLDFASAGLLRPLVEYPEDVLEEALSIQRENFEDRWPEVRRIVFAFEQLDVYLTDVNPRNIMFPEED